MRKVSTTNDHPFYVGSGHYKRADSLQVDDIIFVQDGKELNNMTYVQDGQKLIPETIIDIISIPLPVTVYCLRLEGKIQTYFASGIAVHSADITFLEKGSSSNEK